MHRDVQTYVQTKLYDGMERRKEARYHYKTLVHLTKQTEEEIINGVTTNISESGVKVITPHRFNTHELINLRIGFKKGNHTEMSENFFGRIMSVHTKNNKYHYNIDLRGKILTPEHMKHITEKVTVRESK